MTLPEIFQACSNLGVAVVAAGALIYVHVKQIPAIISALKEEGVENRKALKEEGDVHRDALRELVASNKDALDGISKTFSETLAEDRSRCDAREAQSQQSRHFLAEQVHISVEHRARVDAMLSEVRKLTERLKS